MKFSNITNCRQTPTFSFMRVLFGVMVFILVACGGGGGGESSSPNQNNPTPNPIVTSGFISADEFMENPGVANTISQQDFPIHWGSTPTTLEGSYEVSGYVTDSDIGSLIGQAIASNVCLHNQSLDQIDYTENAQGISITTTGNFLTGSGDFFTIWQEGDVNIGDCQMHNAIILSGTRDYNGNLVDVKTLTRNLSQSNCEAYRVPEWYKTDSDLNLEGSCSDNTDPIRLYQHAAVNGETFTGDKLYYFVTEVGAGCSATDVFISTSNTSGDVLELGVNLPSTSSYPEDINSADVYENTSSGNESITFNAGTTPAVETGRYYILVEQYGNGGTFTIEAYNRFSCP